MATGDTVIRGLMLCYAMLCALWPPEPEEPLIRELDLPLTCQCVRFSGTSCGISQHAQTFSNLDVN